MTHHFVYATASELLRQMEQRECTSRELLEIFMARIARENPRVNAVVATAYEAARQRADAADLARAQGQSWGVLHGLPMTVKDTFEVRGMPCSAGDMRLKHHYPKQHAVVAQRLLDAGAIIFGKTNVPWQARDFQSFNRVYGTTVNPWNKGRSPGGSSGGSAAALAAGFTPVEVGSDLSGSIRIPSHHCGVMGHKPSWGSVPLQGHIPGPPREISALDLWVAGPLARSVDDLELLFRVLAEPSCIQAAEARQESRLQATSGVGGLRFLFWIDDPHCAVDTPIRDALLNLAHELQIKEMHVTCDAPHGVGLHKVCALFLNQLASVTELATPSFYRYLLHGFSPLFRLLGPWLGLPQFFEHYARGAGQSYASWWRHFEKRQTLREEFLKVFQHYDVIIAPVAPNLAVTHQRVLPLSLRFIEVNGKKRPYTDQLMWVSIASLFGLPATAIPLGISREGLPFGLQVIGAPADDFKTMQVARELLKHTTGFQMPPAFA